MNLSELEIEPVAREREGEFLELMDRHHYLGAPYKIGRSAFYAAVLQGRWVALSSFNASAFKSRLRDEWLGWHPRDRDARRHLILNQSRFPVLESIPNLASRVLSLLARRLVRDWPVRTGQSLLLLETFSTPSGSAAPAIWPTTGSRSVARPAIGACAAVTGAARRPRRCGSGP